MAWNTLEFSCGHTTEQQLYGPGADRKRIVAAASREACPACRAAQAATKDAEAGLAVLIGSDKQIAWASSIRTALLAKVDAAALRAQAGLDKLASGEIPAGVTPETIAQATTLGQALVTLPVKLRTITRASWWIDNKDRAPQQLATTL